MDKELKEMLNNLLGDLLKDNKDKINNIIQNRLEEANKQPVTISIEKDKEGKATTKVEGERLAILLALAGLEQTLLKKLNIPNEVWEMLKQLVGTKEVDG